MIMCQMTYLLPIPPLLPPSTVPSSDLSLRSPYRSGFLRRMEAALLVEQSSCSRTARTTPLPHVTPGCPPSPRDRQWAASRRDCAHLQTPLETNSRVRGEH
jgi:hypothetical protein